jgi:SPP1 family predicted phage head-tail adaptor
VQSGRARYLVTVQQNQPSAQASDGTPLDNWVNLGPPVWADITVLTGQELWFARQAQSEVTHKIAVRYSSALADLTGSIRVLYQSRTFHVQWVENVDERNRTLVLHCTEAPDRNAATAPTPPDWYGP